MFKSLLVSLFSLYTATNGQASTEAMSYICGMEELSSSSGISVAFMFDYDASTVTITMQGPSSDWFGVGFGATSMGNTYAIINEGNDDVTERKLGDHNSGSSLTDSFTSETNDVDGDVRTVTVVRSITGSDSDYYTFGTYAADDTLSLIWGTTSGSETLTTHTSKGTGSVTFVETTDPDSAQCTLSATTADDDDDDDSMAYSLNSNYIISFSCLLIAVIAFFQ